MCKLDGEQLWVGLECERVQTLQVPSEQSAVELPAHDVAGERFAGRSFTLRIASPHDAQDCLTHEQAAVVAVFLVRGIQDYFLLDCFHLHVVDVIEYPLHLLEVL